MTDDERIALIEKIARMVKPSAFYERPEYTRWANRPVHDHEWFTLIPNALRDAEQLLDMVLEALAVEGDAKLPRNPDAQAWADLAQRLYRALRDAGVGFESATLIPALVAAVDRDDRFEDSEHQAAKYWRLWRNAESELARALAPVTVTDDMVERAYEALGHSGSGVTRARMRAALVAALIPKEEER